MALAVDRVHADNVSRYERLAAEKQRTTAAAQAWMNDASAFWSGLTDAGEKAEVNAMRLALIAELKAILGL